MLYTEYVSIKFSQLVEKLVYLTHNALTLVTIVSFLGIGISIMKLKSMKIPRFLLRIYQILFQITFTSQVMVFTVYWLAIHHTLEDLIQDLGEEFLYFLIVVHVIPFFCISVDLVFSKPAIDPSESFHLVIYGTVYSVFNFYHVKYNGWRPYPFMLWEDYKSAIAFVVLMVVMKTFYYLASKLTMKLNGVKEKQQ